MKSISLMAQTNGQTSNDAANRCAYQIHHVLCALFLIFSFPEADGGCSAELIKSRILFEFENLSGAMVLLLDVTSTDQISPILTRTRIAHFCISYNKELIVQG